MKGMQIVWNSRTVSELLRKLKNLSLGLLLVFTCHSYAFEFGSGFVISSASNLTLQCPSAEFAYFLDAFTESMEIQ